MLHLGYEIWIEDESGDRIPEFGFQNEGEDGRTVACYIPSESGKKFTIRWKDHNGSSAPHASMRAFLDGARAGKTHCPPGTAGKRVGVSTESAGTYRPFQFARLQTTDEDDAPYGADDALGTIAVRVVHVHAHGKVAPFRPTVFAGIGAVHERSKKAGAHCVSLGATERYGRHHHHIRSRPIVKGGLPHAIFVFRYRPAAILQAQDIMPAELEFSMAGPSSSSDAHLGVKREWTRRPASAEPKLKAGVKTEPGRTVKMEVHPSLSVSGGVIELFSDSEDERNLDNLSRRPVKREYNPGDVIDLTLE